MNIERQQTPSAADPDHLTIEMEGVINNFLATHPDYANRDFSPQEIREAAALLSNANIGGGDNELAQKALDARLTVRASKRGHVADLGEAQL